jgi:type IV pilus assembly protein PilB
VKNDDYLLDALQDLQMVASEHVRAAQTEMLGVVDILLSKGLINKEQIARAKAHSFGYEFQRLGSLTIPPETIAKVPAHIARRYTTIPISMSGNVVKLAIFDPEDLDTIDTLDHLVGKPPLTLEFCVATCEDIEAAVRAHYPAEKVA